MSSSSQSHFNVHKIIHVVCYMYMLDLAIQVFGSCNEIDTVLMNRFHLLE